MSAPEGAVAVLEGAESSDPIAATLPSSSEFPPTAS
jgi:hypothetical protein